MTAGPLIVTRPAEDAAPLVAALAEAGIKTIAAPLMEMHYRDMRINETDYQAILVTSANGCRALGRLKGRERVRDVLTIAVGPASTAAAKAVGQMNVVTSGGDVDALIASVREMCRPESGPLLYVSGAQTTGDLEGRLAADGFTVERIVAYEAVAATVLPAAAEEALQRQSAHGVVLYSPRTARIWVELTDRAGLRDRGAELIHYCLSQNVARVIADAFGGGSGIVTAPEPNESSMLAAIGGG